MQGKKEIYEQYEHFFTFDEPIPYIPHRFSEKIIEFQNKQQESPLTDDEIQTLNNMQNILDKNLLYLYPVTVENYFQFFEAVSCLVIDKNKISDIEVIKMSYLDYLFYLIENSEHGSQWAELLITIFKLCCQLDFRDINYTVDDKGKHLLNIKGIDYDKTDFENIKRIICYQNMPDYDDSYIDPSLEEVLAEAKEMQESNTGTITLERQMICVGKEYHYKFDELKQLPIRKFVQMLQVADAQLHYKIYKTGECSGMASFKKPITHYLYKQDERFDSLINFESFKEKIKTAL